MLSIVVVDKLFPHAVVFAMLRAYLLPLVSKSLCT